MIFVGFVVTAYCSVEASNFMSFRKVILFYMLCLLVEVPRGFCTKVSVHTAAIPFPLKTVGTVITLKIVPSPNTVKINQLFQKFRVLTHMPRA